MRALASFLAPLLGACMQISTGEGDAGVSGASSSSGSSAGNVSSAAVDGGGGIAGGANCLSDPTGTLVLCDRVLACPGLVLDEGAYPNCGFRLGSASPFDLECDCGDFLCPIGVPTSCAQATQLLADQSALTVCEQQFDSRCVPLTTPEAGSGTCDRTCESSCAGAPSCIELCGC